MNLRQQNYLTQRRSQLLILLYKLHPIIIMLLTAKGVRWDLMGDLKEQLSEFEACELYYSDAIIAFNSALHIAPDSIAALNNKGNALQRLANLQAAKLSEPQEAIKNYQEALEMFNRCLAIAPNNDHFAVCAIRCKNFSIIRVTILPAVKGFRLQ